MVEYLSLSVFQINTVNKQIAEMVNNLGRLEKHEFKRGLSCMDAKIMIKIGL